MTFTPDQIASKRFVSTFRGYDPPEVEAFLRAVAQEYRLLCDEFSRRQEDRPAAEGDPFARLRVDLDGILAAAREAARQLEQHARQEAEQIVAAAAVAAEETRSAGRREGEAALEEAHREAEAVRQQAQTEAAALLDGARRRQEQLAALATGQLDWATRLAEETREEAGRLADRLLEQVEAWRLQLTQRISAAPPGAGAGDLDVLDLDVLDLAALDPGALVVAPPPSPDRDA